jgi:hypothetical protein
VSLTKTFLNPDQIALALQSELLPEERIYWSGQPSRKVVFHFQDFLLIPFSILWLGFAVFWEGSVLGIFGSHGETDLHPPISIFMALWGIPFICVGIYFFFGRFIYADIMKKWTVFAVTNQRVIAAILPRKRVNSTAFLANLPMLEKRAGRNGVGTLRFAAPAYAGRRSYPIGTQSMLQPGEIPVFFDIEDVDRVYRLVAELREQTQKNKPA